ncbi:hypothetical protein Efla_005524 [Eimeria flavescens]
MIAPVDAALQADVGVTFAEPEEALDPCVASGAFPLYSVDSELSSEASNRSWSCGLPPCIPPLGLVSAAIGMQLGAGLLLLVAATNGQRLHAIQPDPADPELPAIVGVTGERSPKTYAWCIAYVLSALLLLGAAAAAAAAAVAVCRACSWWARLLRGISIVTALICGATCVFCGFWLSGLAVAQSAITNAAVSDFLMPFNYGTQLFTYKHEHVLRAAGTLAAAAAAAAARTAKATCHDTAAAATTSCYALVAAFAVSFLLMQGALGGMAPPIFGLPAFCLSLFCLLQQNASWCEMQRHLISMLLFFFSTLVACVTWAAAQEMYILNYGARPHSVSLLAQQLRRLVNFQQWGLALGERLGTAGLVCLAAAQAILSLYSAFIMFSRVFGEKLDECKRRRRQRKAEKELRKAAEECPHAHPPPCAGGPPPPVLSPFDEGPSLVMGPLSGPPVRKILVPPPPHAVLP